MFVSLVFFDEPKLDGCALKVPAGTELFLHVAAVAPVQEFGASAEDFEGRDGIVGFLHHVVEFGRTVFEAGRRMAVDDFAQPAVEFGRWDAFVAAQVYLCDKVEDFGDVLAGDAASED